MKRRERYQWNRFYYETEPRYAAAVDYFKILVTKGLKPNDNHDKYKSILDATHELVLHGDCFPFSDKETDQIIILNPDFIEVIHTFTNAGGQPAIYMIPDDGLKKIVLTKQPQSIYDRIPPFIIQMVSEGKPILLSANSVRHLTNRTSNYDSYGTPFLRHDLNLDPDDGRVVTEVLLRNIENCRQQIRHWIFNSIPGFSGQSFDPVMAEHIQPFFNLRKESQELTPVSLRFEKNVLDDLKQKARKMSFELGKDITHVDLVRMYVIEGLAR